ncbi:hypothetical protein [Halpernia frigidisoli]|uniref:Uncharacterized protein n=1 Tax=Halpernia frigidisoli TaxID=1125876 RepID=A0A1I3EFD9_9FLAO|nr:hypothetical protein [Halpernia frigidisoli]SFH97603.1 hypothetical protein SAMN05443292_1045 [Halpernia frigidisoli]
MKLKTILYVLSLLMLFAAIALLVELPNSNRYSTISGILTSCGFGLNIAGYFMPSESTVKKAA